MSQGRGRGQPLLFKSAEELQTKIDAYFDSCYIDAINKDTGAHYKENIRPLTITGLAVDLHTSRETLLNYSNRDDYFDTIHEAKLKIHNFAEESLFTNRSAQGIIFNMKNNYGWNDKTETENINVNTDITNLTDEERTARIAELLGGR